VLEPVLPERLVEARRTPLFDVSSLPAALAKSHRTTVWAKLCVQSGSVRFMDLEGDARRDVHVGAGDSAVIIPGIEHNVEPSTDATFFVQFYREPDSGLVPEVAGTPVDSRRRSGPRERR